MIDHSSLRTLNAQNKLADLVLYSHDSHKIVVLMILFPVGPHLSEKTNNDSFWLAIFSQIQIDIA